MSNGGKRLKELIKKHGFLLGAVAEAIGVQTRTISGWTNNAPIGKLIELSKFTRIPIVEIIDCFDPDLHPQTSDPLDNN
jgi:transcriptional regulator with XRE-family HTH domain